MESRVNDAIDQGSGTIVCIPTYQEAENIKKIVPAVLAALPQAHVLVIDDNSPDGTGKIADTMAQDDQRIFVLHRAEKQGLGAAYLAAFEWALGRDYHFIVQFDADFSHNPKYLPSFIHKLRHDADVVVGSRRVRGGGVENWGWLRRMVSAGGSFYARVILGVTTRDLTGGFNGYRRASLTALDLKQVNSTGYCFQIELKYRAHKNDLRIVEIPIIFPDRVLGKSKMSGAIFAEAIVQVWRLRLTRISKHREDDASQTL